MQIIHKIDDETEVIYSATSAFGPVSSRDFVSLRQIDNSNGCYMSACVPRSMERDLPSLGGLGRRWGGREGG